MTFWKKLFGRPSTNEQNSPYWKCPKCGATLMKGFAWAMDAPIGIVCGRCSATFYRSDLEGGKNVPPSINEAAEAGDLERLRMLLKGDADLVSSAGALGLTPLHWAASKGHKGAAELLITNGAKVNAKSFGGSTPLHLAAASGHKDMSELLLSKRAEVNAKDNDGATPLHEAARKGCTDVAELLRQHGGHE